MAAPIATASSGLTPLLGAFPKNPLTLSYTFGILVIPPTSKTSSTLSFVKPESLRHDSSGLRDLDIKSAAICSNFALVRLSYRCLGPVASADRYAKLTSV